MKWDFKLNQSIWVAPIAAAVVVAGSLAAQTPAPQTATVQAVPAQQTTQPTPQPAPAQQLVEVPAKKAIKDHAEYEAYASAVKIKDPAQQAAALEAFVQKYPRSVAAAQALREALAAWQDAGNQDQVVDVAKRLLVVEPANIRAMAIVVALDRAKAAQQERVDPGLINEICQFSSDGLNALSAWQMPAGMTADEFAGLRNSMTAIFNGGAGTCALSQNDVAKARETLTQAIAIDSTDLQSLWQLSIVDLESRPVVVNGFWYCARAVAIAKRAQNQAAATQATEYCNKKYAAYHGSPEGWDPILVAVQSQDAPPADFSKLITPSENPNAMDTPTEPGTKLLPQPASPPAAQPATPTSPQQ
jgi:tetratricopeptide (TPR) repeat protein